MQKMVGLISDHADELGQLQVLDNAIPIAFNTMYQVGPGITADIFDHHAGWIDKINGETIPPYTGSDMMTLTFREPVGVAGLIIPWNAPLFLFAQRSRRRWQPAAPWSSSRRSMPPSPSSA